MVTAVFISDSLDLKPLEMGKLKLSIRKYIWRYQSRGSVADDGHPWEQSRQITWGLKSHISELSSWTHFWRWATKCSCTTSILVPILILKTLIWTLSVLWKEHWIVSYSKALFTLHFSLLTLLPCWIWDAFTEGVTCCVWTDGEHRDLPHSHFKTKLFWGFELALNAPPQWTKGTSFKLCSISCQKIQHARNEKMLSYELLSPLTLLVYKTLYYHFFSSKRETS